MRGGHLLFLEMKNAFPELETHIFAAALRAAPGGGGTLRGGVSPLQEGGYTNFGATAIPIFMVLLNGPSPIQFHES